MNRLIKAKKSYVTTRQFRGELISFGYAIHGITSQHTQNESKAFKVSMALKLTPLIDVGLLEAVASTLPLKSSTVTKPHHRNLKYT
jgi:hypothetical protein